MCLGLHTRIPARPRYIWLQPLSSASLIFHQGLFGIAALSPRMTVHSAQQIFTLSFRMTELSAQRQDNLVFLRRLLILALWRRGEAAQSRSKISTVTDHPHSWA